MERRVVVVRPPYIKLDAFLKLSGAAATGGQAKEWVQQGRVLVNGEPCTQRGKKLVDGDRVELAGQLLLVVSFA